MRANASSSDKYWFNYSQPSEISLCTGEFGDDGELNLTVEYHETGEMSNCGQSGHCLTPHVFPGKISTQSNMGEWWNW